MKVLWLFPSSEGFPNISQYRFYKKMPIRASIIYPYLASSGITLMNHMEIQADLLDCPTKGVGDIEMWATLTDYDVIVLEARTPNIFDIWKLCEDIDNSNPNMTIILYGDHVSAFPQESLDMLSVDYVVRGGDYDVGVSNLCYALRDQQPNIPRIYNQPRCSTNELHRIPFCDREKVDWRDYYEAWRHRDTFLWTMSGRGCTYRCTYCSWVETLWRNKLITRSPENVADEFEFLHKTYDDLEILDDADLFLPKWGQSFAHNLLRKGLGNKAVLWAFQTHPNAVYNAEYYRTMHRAGLRTVKLGIESLNQETLDRIKKNTTVEQIEKAIKLLKEHKIMVHANLMVGFPWEGKKEAEHTIKCIKKLKPNQAQFSLIIPYPNTDLYDQAKEHGWLSVGEKEWDKFTAERPMLTMEGLTPNEVVDLYQQCWRSFYFDPRYIWKHIKGIRHWEGLKQLWRGYRSVRYGHMEAVKKE